MEKMERPEQTLEQTQAGIKRDIELAEAMKRLKANPDFELIYGNEGQFIKDYVMTQLYNLAGYQAQSRVIVHENQIARSIFMQHKDQLIEDGNLAVQRKFDLAELEAEA